MQNNTSYQIYDLKTLSPEERRKVENKRENLYAQVKALKPKHKHDSGNTQKRYYSSVRQACKFFADNFNTQKFKNITAKQFRAAAAYWKDNNSPNTLRTNLSALRCYCELAGNTNRLPENDELFLTKRNPTEFNRAWLPHEIEQAIKVAAQTERDDIKDALELGKLFGMRVSEVCKLKLSTLRLALGYSGPTIKGKGGRVRYVPIETDEQCALIRRLYSKAKRRGFMDDDLVISRNEKYGPLRQQESIENWVLNHRHKFTDPNRQDVPTDNGKPRSEKITFHGLRHYYAQERRQRLTDAKDPRAKKKLTEGMGHGRLSILEVYT